MNGTLIFTDGAAKGNPGPGGYGAVILENETVIEIGEGKKNTTNNEMELRAVLEALKSIEVPDTKIHLYTDSKYVVEGATGWIFGWMRNGWQTKAGTDVQHKAIWSELADLLKTVNVEWHKVPGHVGLIGNERADAIASAFAEGKTPELFHGPRAEYAHEIENTDYDETKQIERSEKRKRQSQKAYSYISLVDGEVKTHATWAECEARVRGKKNVRFKKALDAEEEKEIIKDFTLA